MSKVKEKQTIQDLPNLMQHNFLEQMRSTVRSLYNVALESADPYKAVINHVRKKGNVLEIDGQKYDLLRYKNIYVVGSGKATAGMAKAIEDILTKREQGDLITDGQISIGYGCGVGIELKKIKINESGHPIPDDASIAGAKKIKELLNKTTENDLVIYLATGGGSAILAMPTEGITLDELQTTTQLLLKSGATLQEINYVRKHLDMVKGGQLARDAYPSTLITLVLSDVVNDPIDMISSGPTVPDPHTFEDAYEVLKKYNLLDKVPESVKKRIERGLRGEIPDTPKENEPWFERTKSIMVGTNAMAVSAMGEKVKEMGFDTLIIKEPVTGEARNVAIEHARNAIKMAMNRKTPLFILSGGETTVTIKGNGAGGRNQEYTLAFALEMEKQGFENFVCLSCGTDGIDNIREAAGAMIDGTSLKKARKIGLSPEQLLNNNDSYHFHEPIGTLIKTGPTGTNVNDVQIVVVW